MSAASRAVNPPIHAMTVQRLRAGRRSRKNTRHSMYTPAATIVAAWISALTGVGPSMASGSQTCSGNCALLPIAPQKISRPAAVASAPSACGLAARAFSMLVEVQRAEASPRPVRMPSRKPKSPRRLVMKAFLPASAAAGLSNQKPMSR